MSDAHSQRGIYAVVCDETGDCYIGSSSRRFEERWEEHLRELEEGHHGCLRLQEAWDRHGRGAMSFLILEAITSAVIAGLGTEYLRVREREHIRAAIQDGYCLNDCLISQSLRKQLSVRITLPEEVMDVIAKRARLAKVSRHVLMRDALIELFGSKEGVEAIASDSSRRDLDLLIQCLHEWLEEADSADGPFESLRRFAETVAAVGENIAFAERQRKARYHHLRERLKAIEGRSC